MSEDFEGQEHKCCCGGHGDGEHECGCGGHGDGEHECGCGGHGDGEHKCGCGGHGDGEHKCGCKEHAENDPFEDMRDIPLPKPTLVTLATTLAQQAMISMGILPNPATGKSVFLMNQATYLIDTVDLLFEKTAGNRTDEETKIVENIIHELRMLYIKASEELARRKEEQKND